MEGFTFIEVSTTDVVWVESKLTWSMERFVDKQRCCASIFFMTHCLRNLLKDACIPLAPSIMMYALSHISLWLWFHNNKFVTIVYVVLFYDIQCRLLWNERHVFMEVAVNVMYGLTARRNILRRRFLELIFIIQTEVVVVSIFTFVIHDAFKYCFFMLAYWCYTRSRKYCVPRTFSFFYVATGCERYELKQMIGPRHKFIPFLSYYITKCVSVQYNLT